MEGAARADLCRFIAACYYEPAPEFEEEKLFDSIVASAVGLDPELGESARRLRERFREETLDDLLVDYARLFLGPSGALAQPYGSAWLSAEKTLMQDSTVAVAALYEEGGFDLHDDFHDLPDHVAAELEFLYLLIFREHQRDQPLEGGIRRRLLNEHLGRWVPPFAAAVRNGAKTAFYRELADLTERFVRSELDSTAERPSCRWRR